MDNSVLTVTLALLGKVELFVMQYGHSRKGNNMIKNQSSDHHTKQRFKRPVSDLNITIKTEKRSLL